MGFASPTLCPETIENSLKVLACTSRKSEKMANSATAKMFSLEGQTAVVTGGTRGIGQAAAVALAEAGADIILIQVYLNIS
jgi:hypothetical protein